MATTKNTITLNDPSKADSRLTKPQAVVVVWNYMGRMGADSVSGSSQPDAKNETNSASTAVESVIALTASVKSIKVQKVKSAPAGTFEIELSPTENWVARLTPGSWLAIYMTQDINLTANSIDSSNISIKSLTLPGVSSTQNSKMQMLKMVGRIDAVRCSVMVDPSTAARNTNYIVTGRDWGCVFDSVMYVDGLALADQTAPGLADLMVWLGVMIEQGGFGDKVSSTPTITGVDTTKAINNKGGDANFLPTTTETIQKIKDFFGSRAAANDNTYAATLGTHLYPSQIMMIPPQMSSFIGFNAGRDDAGQLLKTGKTALADLIKVKPGVIRNNKYVDVKESVGVPDLKSFCAGNTFWQIITHHSNTILNEVIAEMSWEDPNRPMLCLYKRLKPFVLSKSNMVKYQNMQNNHAGSTAVIDSLTTRFIDLPVHTVPPKDVLNIDAGTNWRDAINFVEILWHDPMVVAYSGFESNNLKRQSQIINRQAIARDGLKAMREVAHYMPHPDQSPNNTPAPLVIAQWAPLLYEWYSHTNTMLNGTVSFMGQNEYIAVGSNIRMDAGVLGAAMNNNSAMANLHAAGKNVYLLAHVESISHQFSVSPTGGRSFMTTVQFVRGVFIDDSNNLYWSSGDAIDHDAADTLELAYSRQKIATSTPLDPNSSAARKGE